ncbi:MAG: PEP-CTERM sorting domain-containing protein [Fimbriimonadales bacterium]
MKVISTLGLAMLAVFSVADPFHFLVAETPGGSVGQDQWGGVRRYDVSGSGGTITQGVGIAKQLLSDPAGLALGPGGELFVGNRHGNSNPSSVSRFLYDGTNYVPNGTITGNSLFGSHGLNFSPTGELFVANVNGPVSRFLPSGGNYVANGNLNSGSARDVFFSSNGQYAYVTNAGSSLAKFDVATGSFLSTLGIAGSSGVHNGNWLGNALYLAANSSGTVHRLTFDANGDIATSDIVASVSDAISLDFSPDGQEMFVAGHRTGNITRFGWDGSHWNQTDVLNVGVNLGDIQVVPEPGSLMALAAGSILLLLRRRTR